MSDEWTTSKSTSKRVEINNDNNILVLLHPQTSVSWLLVYPICSLSLLFVFGLHSFIHR